MEEMELSKKKKKKGWGLERGANLMLADETPDTAPSFLLSPGGVKMHGLTQNFECKVNV